MCSTSTLCCWHKYFKDVLISSLNEPLTNSCYLSVRQVVLLFGNYRALSLGKWYWLFAIFFFHCNYVISVKRASHRQGRKNIKTLNKTKWILLTVTKHRILQTLCFELISRLSCLCEHSSFWQSIKLWNNPSSRILISAWNSLTLNHQKKSHVASF